MLKQTFEFAVIVNFFELGEEWILIALAVTYYEADLICKSRSEVDNTIVKVVKLEFPIEITIEVEI